ncbi:MAG: branched-chain amino acid ABC transporter permease [Hyphomicrobiales bacterium]|nr:branched-chain amino acid ABC transporter permease [Hyphomicrobiales bacterium]
MSIRSSFWPLFGVFMIAAIAAPLTISSVFWMDFLTLTLFLAVLGQGWNILGGYGGQFSFGHAVFFGTGAYLQVILQAKLGFNPWAAIPFAIFGGIVIGAFTGFLSFRYGLRGSYFALITLAFAEAFRVLATSAEAITDGGQGIYITLNQDPSRALATLQFGAGNGYYFCAVVMTVMSLLVAYWIENSRFGAQLIAIREDEDAAEAIGVNAFKVKMQAICLSGAITAFGGVFYAQKFLLMDPNIAYGPVKSVEMLVMPIIGGMGTIFGPLVGSFFLHSLGEVSKEAAHALVGDRPGLDLIVYGIALVLILALLPNGLVGLMRKLLRREASRA